MNLEHEVLEQLCEAQGPFHPAFIAAICGSRSKAVSILMSFAQLGYIRIVNDRSGTRVVLNHWEWASALEPASAWSTDSSLALELTDRGIAEHSKHA